MMRKATVAEPDSRFDVQAAFVGAAMKLRFVHAVQHRTIDVALASGVKDAGDAAHGVSCQCLLALVLPRRRRLS